MIEDLKAGSVQDTLITVLLGLEQKEKWIWNVESGGGVERELKGNSGTFSNSVMHNTQMNSDTEIQFIG